jgi:TRAP-type C4-dicarboxylate transport system permease small subunit
VLSSFLQKISYGLIIITMILMSVIYFMQVIFRYVLKLPLAWTGEISVLAMLWLAFVGPTVLVKSNGFISVTLLKLKGRGKKVVSIVLDAVVLIILGLLTYYSLLLAIKFKGDILPATGLPRAVVYLALFFGALLMLLCFVEKTISSIKKLVSGEEGE